MNTVVTSSGQILDAALSLAREKGLEALDMRGVAARCGVAVGSIYNYFPSKGDLICAVVGEIWRGIFHEADRANPPAGFSDTLERLYSNALRGAAEYPAFFTAHARLFSAGERVKGRQAMLDMFAHMRAGLTAALDSDINVRADAFDAEFTREEFVDFAFDSIMALLSRDSDSCATLLKVVKRLIY